MQADRVRLESGTARLEFDSAPRETNKGADHEAGRVPPEAGKGMGLDPVGAEATDRRAGYRLQDP